ncbi:MAG TPA: hypothetical protein VFE28_10205 [Candidatus Krumholzibacteria bacterium]|nr:hypothetical protein [Candidatus Krumholzibacteria bacterium]
MRVERVVRFAGLVLVLLFPLLSVLQLRDTDRPWRETARRARPSVLGLLRPVEAGFQFAHCGVVIQVDPARLVVPGPVSSPLLSRHGTALLEWRPLFTDVHGEFTVFEVAPDSARAAAALAATAALVPAKLVFDPSGNLTEDVEAALVAPKEMAEEPLWVGVLSVGPGKSGRLGYYSSFLTPISSTQQWPASTAFAAGEPEIDPKLLGAPFVDAEGTVVAIFLDRGAHGVHALPLEIVAQALALLQLQAAQ